MRSKMLLVIALLLGIALFPSGCGNVQGCPLCGTTKNDGVAIVDVMGVPGAAGPGGTAFTVFDLGLVDSANHRYYVTDRSQTAVLVYDTLTDRPAGPASGGQIGSGSFVGAICCAQNRAANFNPLTGPNAAIRTPGGSTGLGLLWVTDGDSTVKVFDAATGAPITASQIAGGGVLGAGQPSVPCAHAPGGQGGLGGSAFNPNTGKFLVSNTQNASNPADSEITEIDPKTGKVTNDFQLAGLGCQPSFVVVGPAPNVLVACENFTGSINFPPSEIVINGSTGKIITIIDKVGGVDQAAFNPTDNRYYVAARDMPGGPVLGVIDAVTNTWLQNVPSGANAHSVAADPMTNHVFVPLQPSASCRAFSNFGCIAVYAQQ